MKKIILLVLVLFLGFVCGCSKSFEFESYESIKVHKNYDLAENTYEEVALTDSEEDELFSLVNNLKIREENSLMLDIKGYLYQIYIDEEVINIVNAEFCYYKNQLYEMTSGQEELILFLTEK